MTRHSSAAPKSLEFRLANGTVGQITGDGPPLVLLHGVGLEQTMWREQVCAFAADYTVITYDLLGHGKSPPVKSPVALDDYRTQLEDLWRAHNLDGAILVGFSFGGMIARNFAIRRGKQLAALVLLSTVFERSGQEKTGVNERLKLAKTMGPDTAYRAALERWFSSEFRAAQPDALKELLARMQQNDRTSFIAAYELFATGNGVRKDELSSIACPTLVMTGELDRGSTPTMARKMANAIPGATVSVISGGLHMMAIELAQKVNLELARFFAGLSEAQALSEQRSRIAPR